MEKETIEAILESYHRDENIYNYNSEITPEKIENIWIETTPRELLARLNADFDIENSANWENHNIVEIIFLSSGNIAVNML